MVISSLHQGVSASGKALQMIEARAGDNLISAEIQPVMDRLQYQTTQTAWYDHKLAGLIEEAADALPGEVASEYRRFSTGEKGHAGDTAGATAAEIDRNKGAGSMTINVTNAPVVEAPLRLSGCRPGIDGTYLIGAVEHTLNRTDGYVTRLVLRRPGEGAGIDGR